MLCFLEGEFTFRSMEAVKGLRLVSMMEDYTD
jgi:hypothetical protein